MTRRSSPPLPRLLCGLIQVLLLMALPGQLMAAADPAATVASAITASSSAEQRDLVLSLKSHPTPEAVAWLEKWKGGSIYLHEDTAGVVTPVTLTGEPDAAGTSATVRVADGKPFLAADGSPIRINPAEVEIADTDSGLRRAMKEVVNLAALAHPDLERRIRAIQDSAIGQDPAKLPELLLLKGTEKEPAALRALNPHHPTPTGDSWAGGAEKQIPVS
jgi:urea transport system permease protein